MLWIISLNDQIPSNNNTFYFNTDLTTLQHIQKLLAKQSSSSSTASSSLPASAAIITWRDMEECRDARGKRIGDFVDGEDADHGLVNRRTVTGELTNQSSVNHVQTILARDGEGKTRMMTMYSKLEWPSTTMQQAERWIKRGNALEPVVVRFERRNFDVRLHYLYSRLLN